MPRPCNGVGLGRTRYSLLDVEFVIDEFDDGLRHWSPSAAMQFLVTIANDDDGYGLRRLDGRTPHAIALSLSLLTALSSTDERLTSVFRRLAFYLLQCRVGRPSPVLGPNGPSPCGHDTSQIAFWHRRRSTILRLLQRLPRVS